MENVIDSTVHRGIKVEVVVDDSGAFSPRENDNLGVMVCSHRRYSLGDEQVEALSGDFNSWNDIAKYLRDEREAEVILPIFMLDHSSVHLSVGPEHDPQERPQDPFRHYYMGMDSGQVGFIYATRAAILENYGVKRLTKAIRERAIEVLTAEVKEYGAYVNGDVYGYVVTDPDNPTSHDSCWGFIGDTDYTMKEGIEAANYMADERDRENAEMSGAMTLAAAAGMH